MEDNIILKIDVEAPNMSEVDKALDRLGKSAETASMSFDELNAHMKEEADAIKVVSDEVKNLIKEQSKLSRGEEAYKKITAQITKMQLALTNVGKANNLLDVSIKKVSTSYGNFREGFSRLVESAKSGARAFVSFFTSAEVRSNVAKKAVIGLLDASYAVGDALKSAFNKGVAAAKTFGKALLATGIGAIVGLVAALAAKMSENEKIARAVSSVFQAIGKLLDPIVDFVADIVDGLMSGKESLTGWYESVGGISGLFEKLLDFLKSQFEVRLKAISNVFEAIVNLDFSSLGSNLVDAFTGVENTVGKVVEGVKSLGESVVDDAKKIYAAETAAANLYKQINALTQQQSLLNQRVSELNDYLSDGNLAAYERLEATKELNSVNEKVLALEIEKKRKELAIEKQLAAAKGMSEEAEKSISDKTTELLDLQAQYNSLVNSGRKALENMSSEMDAAAEEFAFAMEELRRSNEALDASLVDDEFKRATLEIEKGLIQTLATIDKAEQDMLDVAKKSARSREEYELNVSKVKAAMAERRVLEEKKAQQEIENVLRVEKIKGLEKSFAEESMKRKELLRSGQMELYEFNLLEIESERKLIEEKLELVEKGGKEELALRQQLSENLLNLRSAELSRDEAEFQKRLALIESRGRSELKSEYAINMMKLKAEDEYLKALLSREDLSASERIEIERRVFENKRSILTSSLEHAKEQFANFSGMVSEIVSGVTSAISEISNRQIAEEEEKFARRNESLDEAVKKGLKTQEQADREREVAENQMRKRINKEKEKQAKIEKGVALFNAIVTGAQAVLSAFASAAAIPVVGWTIAPIQAGIAAALAAVQIGLIASQPLPKFRKGVLALDGPGDGESDSILARLSKGESVMTAKETKMFYPTLKAIRDNQVEPSMLNEFATGGWKVVENRIVELTQEVKKKEMVVVNADESGFAVFTINQNKKWEWLNKRYNG